LSVSADAEHTRKIADGVIEVLSRLGLSRRETARP